LGRDRRACPRKPQVATPQRWLRVSYSQAENPAQDPKTRSQIKPTWLEPFTR
jgi:hypothetical protein